MSTRAELLAALGVAGRDRSNAEVMFHTVLSERMGVSTVEERRPSTCSSGTAHWWSSSS